MINSYAIYIEKLEPEYKPVFKKISDYVYASNMDEVRNEEMLSEVMDTFLSAQSEGRSVEEVVGGDLESFCKGLCSDIGVKSRIINFLEVIYPTILCLGIFNVLDLIDMFGKISDGEKINFFTYRSEEQLWGFLLGGLIVVIIGYVGHFFIKRLVFTRPETYKRLAFTIKALSFAAIFAVILILFGGTEVKGTYLWVSLLFCAAFMTVYRIVTRRSRQYRRENRISLSELAGESMDLSMDMEKTEMKRFEKLNKKNARRGKPELTFEQFLDHEEKSCSRWDKRPGFYVFIVIASTVLGLVFTLFFGGFEGFSDMLIFIGIMLAVESAVMYGLFRLTDIGNRAMLSWIREKRESGRDA